MFKKEWMKEDELPKERSYASAYPNEHIVCKICQGGQQNQFWNICGYLVFLSEIEIKYIKNA